MFYPDKKQKKALLEGIGLMCQIFWGPNPDLCKQIIQGAILASFEALDPVLSCNPSNALEEFKSVIKKYSDSNSLFEELQEDYVRLFVSDRDGIAAPLYQSCYEFENAPLMGSSAIEMKNRLESKGLALADNLHEPPDHLCIELEYLYFTLQKGWEGRNGFYVKEGATFASETMFPWVDAFYKRTASKNPYSFFSFATCILCALLNLIGRIDNPGTSGL